MEVHPTPEQEAFIRDAIASGPLHRPEEAMQEALSLWEERERRRAVILAAVDTAEASLARGEGRTITSREGAATLADEIKQRGMARLALSSIRADERVSRRPRGRKINSMRSGYASPARAAASTSPIASLTASPTASGY